MADRDAKGRFVKGHKPLKGAGRPKRSLEEKYLKTFSATVRKKDIREILLVAMARARAGDFPFVRLMLEYAFGKPKQQMAVEGDVEFRFPKAVVFIGGGDTDQPPPGPVGDSEE